MLPSPAHPFSDVQYDVEIKAPASVVYEVLTDFSEYPRFLRMVKGCRASTQSNGHVLVEYTIEVVRRFAYSLQVVLEPGRRVAWELVDGEFLRENRGCWQLESLGPARTRLSYQLDLRLKTFIPRAIQNRLFATTLPDAMAQFRAEAERRAAKKGS